MIAPHCSNREGERDRTGGSEREGVKGREGKRGVSNCKHLQRSLTSGYMNFWESKRRVRERER